MSKYLSPEINGIGCASKPKGNNPLLSDRQLLEYQAERSLAGYLGLWTKADSVTLLKGFGNISKRLKFKEWIG